MIRENELTQRQMKKASEGRWAKAHFRYHEILSEILGFSEIERVSRFDTVEVEENEAFGGSESTANSEMRRTMRRTMRRFDFEQAYQVARWGDREAEMLDYAASLVRASALGLYVDSRLERVVGPLPID